MYYEFNAFCMLLPLIRPVFRILSRHYLNKILRKKQQAINHYHISFFFQRDAIEFILLALMATNYFPDKNFRAL